MEPLPKGANFVRAKTLWEIGLHIAGNPATPYGGNRDMAAWKMIGFPGARADFMDFVDLYSLHGRKPTMVLYDVDDPLYTPKGQEDADSRLRAIYAKMGAPELYVGKFYPGPHKFDIEMQEYAFDFFDKWLK